MDFDLRTRTIDDVEPVDPVRFHDETVPALLAEPARADLAARAMVASGRRSMTLAVDERPWTWRLDDRDALSVTSGDTGEGPRADLSGAWFTDIVNDVRSTVAVMIANEPVMARGRIGHLVNFEPVLRALLDGRPGPEPGLIDFVGRDGAPLDLASTFTLDDDPAELTHFLAQTGFLHLRAVFDAADVAAIDNEITSWRNAMTPENERAWYARVGDEQVCVRVTSLAPGDLEFPFGERLAPVAALTGAGHRAVGTDLLVKPVGVTEGISDLPWHKDCELGGHSYRCTSINCGVSVTPSGPDNGQLGVLAGSHRQHVSLMDVEGVGLPQVFLSTEPGDVTVHLSCALHCATPPRHAERRVTYTDLRLPGDTRALDAKIRAVRDQAGRDTYAPGGPAAGVGAGVGVTP